MFRFRQHKLVAASAFVAAGAMSISAYAFTASNTVPDHSAGAGVGTVSGYTVSSPSNYTFSPDGTTIESVTFDLDKAATDVKVALTAAAPTQIDWTDCGAAAATTFAVTCTFNPAIPVGNALKLNVAAVSSGTVTISGT